MLLRLVLVPLASGAGLVRAMGLSPSSDRIAYFAWSWVAGVLVTALVLFAWLWFQIPAPWAIDLVLTGLGAGLFAWGRARRPQAPLPVEPQASWDRRLFDGVLLFVLVLSCARLILGTLEVIHRADEATFWSLHGKMIFDSGGFTAGYSKAIGGGLLLHGDYPLLNPLLHVWTYLHYGEITQAVNRVPFLFFSLSVVLVLAAGLRRVRPGWVGALLLLIQMGCFQTSVWAWRAQSDVIVALGALLLLDGYLRHSRGGGEGVWWRLSVLGMSLALWGKNEGMLVLVALLAALALHVATSWRRLGRGGEARWAYALPLLFVVLSYGFNLWFGHRSDVLTGDGAPSGQSIFAVLLDQGVERIPIVAGYFWDRILAQPRHSGFTILILFGVWIVMPRRIWRTPLGVPGLALALFVLGMFVIFLGSGRDLEKHLRSAAARVVFQCVPALLLWLGALWDELRRERLESG